MVRQHQISQYIFYTLTVTVIALALFCFYQAFSWINRPFAGFLTYHPPFAGSFSSKDWTGTVAGIRYLDRLTTIDGQAIQFGSQTPEAIQNRQPGEMVSYGVVSKGSGLTVDIPVDTFEVKDFLLIFMVPFSVGLIVYVLGFVVFVLKPHGKTSWVFLLLCFGVCMYGVCGFEIQSTYHLVPFERLIMCCFPAFFFHLGLIFPERKKILTRWPSFEYLIYIPTLILVMLNQAYLLTYPDVYTDGSFTWLPGYAPLSTVARFFTLFCVFSLVGCVLHATFKADSIIARQRAKMILLGVSVAFFPPGILMVSALTLKYYFPFNLIAYFTIFFPLSIAYSIVRHNLFEADTIVKRTVGYVIVTLIIITSYALTSVGLNTMAGAYQIAQSRAFPVLFTLFFILVFNPLQRRVQSVVDRIFFRKEYDYGQVIDKIGSVVTSFADLNHILMGLTQTFIKDMFIDNTSVMLLSPDGSTYRTAVCEGDDREEIGAVEIPAEDPLIDLFDREKKEITRFDMIESPRLRSIAGKSLEYFDALKASLSIPLIYQDKVIGLLSVGEKKSGKMYRQEDIEIFNAAAKQGAVAIENARLFQENLEKQRMEEELNIARDLQTSMLPATCPTVEGYDIAAFSIPAREVGGDFYDFAETRDGNLAFVVGDVTGKSVSGALVMAASRSIFRMLSEEALGVSEIMMRANRRAKKDIKTGMFVALLYAVLDIREKRLRLCSAGQTQPVVLSGRTGNAALLETTGDTFPLGILDDVDYQETLLQLQSGDKVVLYTDGIVEAMNSAKEIFGFERLVEIVQGNGTMESGALLDEIRRQVDDFTGDAAQHDDLTVIVISVH